MVSLFQKYFPRIPFVLLSCTLFFLSCGSSEPANAPDHNLSGSGSEPAGQTKTSQNSDFAPYIDEIPESDESLEMVPVPGGSFYMWDAEKNSKHEVEVDSFWIGKFEITWNQYNLFTEESLEDIRRQLYLVMYDVDIESDALSSPSLTREVLELLREAEVPSDVISKPSPSYGDMTGGMGFDEYPAINMTQFAAHMFTRWLTIKTGEFYRLPTEAEWEYACRAGQNEDYSRPAGNDLEQMAWYRGNSNRKYHQVDTKEPNALGIYNMLGNVSEWTLDQYHPNYIAQLEDEPAVNPWFKPEELYPRTTRGGSWTEPAEAANCLYRKGSQPRWKMNDPQLPKSLWWHTNAPFVGFRVVKPKKQPESVDDYEAWWIDAMQDYF
jgi:formylglycine-generating enzyme required for sulfatase activity